MAGTVAMPIVEPDVRGGSLHRVLALCRPAFRDRLQLCQENSEVLFSLFVCAGAHP